MDAVLARGPRLAKCRAFPKSGATCPSGYMSSFAYCVETGCEFAMKKKPVAAPELSGH